MIGSTINGSIGGIGVIGAISGIGGNSGISGVSGISKSKSMSGMDSQTCSIASAGGARSKSMPKSIGIIGSIGGTGVTKLKSRSISFMASRRPSRSRKSSDRQTSGNAGVRFARGAGVGCAGLAPGVAGTGAGGGVGTCAPTETAPAANAATTTMKVALIILASF